MKRFFFILLVLALWALIFVSTMPLQFAVDKIRLPENLQLSHLHGSVWSGGAHLVYTQNRVPVLPETIPVDFAWRWCSGWKRGLLAVCMEADHPDFRLDGVVSYSPWSNRLLVRDTRLSFALAYLNLSVPIMGRSVKPKAAADLSIEELRIDPISGSSRGRMTGTLQKLELGFAALGDYSLRSELEDSLLLVDYAGQAEEFKLSGDARVNFAAWQYEYDADLWVDNAGFFDILKAYAQSAQGKKLTFASRGRLPF